MTLLSIHRYLKGLERSIPDYIIGISVIILALCIVLFIAIKGKKNGLKYGIRLLLADYVFIILCSTVIFRKSRAQARFDFMPFRTYYEIFSCKSSFLLPQAIMNILVFIPLGLLLSASFPIMKWWKLLFMGAGFSLVIELLQLLFHKGFSEFDDVMHNSLGCLMGILCYKACHKFFRDGGWVSKMQ